MKTELFELVKKAKTGDETAFIALYQMYYSSIYKQALTICKNEADAHDITQEAFFYIRKYLPTLQHIEAFPHVCKRIVIGCCDRMFRKNNVTYLDPNVIQNSVIQEWRQEMSLMQTIDNRLEKEELTKIIKTLKPQYQEVIDYIYLKQMKYDEVAQILQVPVGTVKTRTMRAKSELLKKIEEYQEKEQRYMWFHQLSAFPILLSTALLKKWKALKQKVFDPKVLQATSICAMVGLSVVPINQLPKLMNAQWNTRNEESENSVIEQVNTFQPILYKNEWINHSRKAYYRYIAEIKHYSQIKEITKEESEQLGHLLTSLKQTNDHWYQRLQQDEEVKKMEQELKCN